jgi:hypothetical protein
MFYKVSDYIIMCAQWLYSLCPPVEDTAESFILQLTDAGSEKTSIRKNNIIVKKMAVCMLDKKCEIIYPRE